MKCHQAEKIMLS